MILKVYNSPDRIQDLEDETQDPSLSQQGVLLYNVSLLESVCF